jgi:hypothetical protein
LLTDPAFLGKNQIPDKGAEPIYIPALPQDSDSVSLCPVRILSSYLTLSASLRSSTNKKLFIPIKKGDSDLSIKTISTWICKIMSLAYESSGQVILDKFLVNAHYVRALASSRAVFNNASLNEVLSAGFWRGVSSFLSHYLRSMSVHANNLFSLKPIVSAQRVNFHPVSSDSGIQLYVRF